MTGTEAGDETWSRALAAFTEAAQWFVGTAALVGERWDAPGLGEWDVRSLVGHTSRALLTVESYLGQPADAVVVASTADYYAVTRDLAAGPDVAARGRAAGEALGGDPAATVAEIAGRVVPVVASCDGTELLTTIAGGMRLADYLPSRTFELVVHTLDLAAALGVPAEPPPLPAREALGLVADLAVAGGHSGSVLRAATGRGPVGPGFSVM